MRGALEIVGIVLLINGIGGLIKDDFGLLTHVTDGGALTALQVGAIVVGAVLAGGSLLSRRSARASGAQ